jgi:hypothetical protein
MKKTISFILVLIVFITFTISVNAAPPSRIIIRGEEELAELRIMAEADDEELAKLLGGYFSDNGIRTRENLISFLELLNSLPIPYIKETKFSSLSYRPESQRVNIFFETEIGETHSYYYFLDENRNEASFPTETQNLNLNEHGAISFTKIINGFSISVGYNRGNNEHITTFNPYEVYKDMTVSSFAEAPWSTIPVTFTTSDALAILRHVAGIELLPAADSEITTADALAILRIVAGLA